MKQQAQTVRTVLKSAMFAATTAGIALASAALAQPGGPPGPPLPPAPSEAEAPELYRVTPIPKYEPKKTPWGEPDLQGGWPIDSLGGLPLQRTPAQGNRVYLTDAEFEQRERQMDRSRGAAEAETKANKLGMGNWVEMTGAGRRTSLIVDPPNGRLPELTPYGDAVNRMGRSSWVNGQTFDWTTDYDNWDRCITRGFPASMLPFRYNNGVRILQAPGIVVIDLEMIHDSRIIYTNDKQMPPKGVTNWMGYSKGHWEGNTLVIETSNIRKGASPLNMATIGSPANNTVPMSDQAKVVERLTLAGPDTLIYEMTYSDPKVWTKPYTIRMDIPRKDDYEFFEYACHEGNVQARNYISSSRSLRQQGITVDQQGPARE